MPVRADEIFVTFNPDTDTDTNPEKSRKTSRRTARPTTQVGVSEQWLTPMLADPFSSAHVSLADAVGSTLFGVAERLATASDLQRALATQFAVGSAIDSMTSVVAEQLDWTASKHVNTQSPVANLGMSSPPFPQVAVGSHDLTIFPDLHSLPGMLAMASLEALAPRTAIETLSATYSIEHLLMDSGALALHSFRDPLDFMQGFAAAVPPVWDVGPTGVFGQSLTDWFDGIVFPQPTIDHDLLVLLQPSADPAQREAALYRIADRMPWRPRRNPQVWRAIVLRAKVEQTSVRAIVHRELTAAILLVLATRQELQTVRFGREWLTGDDGRKIAFPPHELPTYWFRQWLCSRAIAMAEATVLERPFPATADILDRPVRNGQPAPVLSLDAIQERAHGGDALGVLLLDRNDPLTLLIAQHERDEDAARLLAVLQLATRRQRELLALIATGLTEAEAARRLGMAPATARTQLYRLRRKVM